ncbi:MAG: TIGR03087 family PEP-CTERM/XrtA system glycosyltransferase [Thiobacillaceae bacterium]
MAGILYLVHRLPYPPNKGDKIRSFHLLKYLASKGPVYLGTFIDNPADRVHRQALGAWCKEIFLAEIKPLWAKLASLRGMLTGEALTLPYYRQASLSGWVKQLVEQGLVDRVVAFSSAMAQFVPAGLSLKLMDMVDVDSDKWAQYAPTQPWPLSWLYRREAEKLAKWENQAARTFDATFLVSQTEASLLKARAPDAVDRIHWFENGVDAFHFSPEHELPNPYPKGVMPIVFTGAMDYWPNVDAVRWFAETVFPRVKAALPDAVFFIVGSDPTETVQHLSRISGVTVTGTVPDVRPYLKHAACAVAPLRLARGVQNKVLEAMSMARPVVASPQATEGISAEVGLDLLEAGDEQSFAEQVIRVCEGLYPELGQNGRATVLRSYDWEKNLSRLDVWL